MSRREQNFTVRIAEAREREPSRASRGGSSSDRRKCEHVAQAPDNKKRTSKILFLWRCCWNSLEEGNLAAGELRPASAVARRGPSQNMLPSLLEKLEPMAMMADNGVQKARIAMRVLRQKAETESSSIAASQIQPGGCLLHRVRWRRVVLDEAHGIKNPSTASAKACSLLTAERRWYVRGGMSCRCFVFGLHHA